MSIVAHSLGAIICFDIMANQPHRRGVARPGDTGDSVPGFSGASVTTGAAAGFGSSHVPAQCDRDRVGVAGARASASSGVDGGSMRCYRGSKAFPELSTRVENMFCLGSPIGMFLMIRGQHRGLGKQFRLPG